jgi:hypothetical protein
MSTDIRTCDGTCESPHVFCVKCLTEQPTEQKAFTCINCGESPRRVVSDCRQQMVEVVSAYDGRLVKARMKLQDRSKPRFTMWLAPNDKPQLSSRKSDLELRFAIDHSRSLDSEVRISRIVDRAQDQYKERVETPDGRLIRRVEEPLSKHVGHGTAKRNDDERI